MTGFPPEHFLAAAALRSEKLARLSEGWQLSRWGGCGSDGLPQDPNGL